MKVSIVICTHNPRKQYLCRVLDALKAQTLSKDQWELLCVDNYSDTPLSNLWDLSWHVHGRHVREEKLGLTYARVRGIEEAAGDLVIFVDDDNILSPAYLENALALSDSWPHLGVWGGSSDGEFEEPVPSYLESHIGLLAIGNVDRDSWSNLKGFTPACPFGAGLVIRKDAALAYVNRIRGNNLHAILDRKGTQLTSGGDIDMAWSVCDLGYGMGRFTSLKLTHLIPSERLKLNYFERLIEGGAYSNVFLHHIHNLPLPYTTKTIWAYFRRKKQLLLTSRAERKLSIAADRGTLKGIEHLNEILNLAPTKSVQDNLESHKRSTICTNNNQ